SSTGVPLLPPDALDLVRNRLVPLAVCVTPNLDEAEWLTGRTVRAPEAMADAGRAILDMGARSVLVKGGHLASDILRDVLVTPDNVERYTRTRAATRATHGTGCTLAAAITAQLALGTALDVSVRRAIEYVQAAMRAAPGFGQGSGPLWHGVETRPER